MSKATQFIALNILLLSGMCYGAKPALNDTYTVVGSSICQSNDAGFTDFPALHALGPVYQVLDSWEGKMQFFPNGTVTHVTNGQYALPGNPQPAGTYTSNCQYVSTANPDGSFTLDGSCQGHVLSGIALGENNIASPVRWTVFPGSGTIQLSHVGVEVQTLTTDQSGTHYRICQGHGSGT